MFSSHAFNVLIAFDLIYLLAKFKFEDLQSVKNAKLWRLWKLLVKLTKILGEFLIT